MKAKKKKKVHFLQIFIKDEWKESQAPALQHEDGLKGRKIKNAERYWMRSGSKTT